MSSTHFTYLSKFKPSFFNTIIQPFLNPGWFINWPKGMPYSNRQNLLKSHLWFIGTNNHVRPRKPKKNKKLSRKYRMFLRASELRKDQLVEQQTQAIISHLQTGTEPDQISNSLITERPKGISNEENVQLELITMLKQFCERKHLPQLVRETISDRRNQELITYSKESIMMAALAIFLFRMESGNKFDEKSHDEDEKYAKTNIAKFIGAPDDQVPVIKTIEKFLKNLAENSVNSLMIVFFKDLLKSKFFKQHLQIMPGNFFLLAADCVHTHTYDHPYHIDINGNNDCKCCLKRIYNKGTKTEKIRWLHNTLVFSFVFMGGLKIPIYRYPIHAKQVVNLESASEENHKQECELVALKTTLPTIRQAFPKMKIVLLLDGLYANRPVIQLAQEHKCEWLFSWRLSGKICELAARQGRARGEIEDLFQSLKDRGYKLKHDYSRDPRSCFNWQGLALLAFGIFELFRFSEAVKHRSDLSQIALAEKLEGQLLYKPTEEIFSEKQLSKRIQFRYDFVVELMLSKEMPSKVSQESLRPG